MWNPAGVCVCVALTYDLARDYYGGFKFWLVLTNWPFSLLALCKLCKGWFMITFLNHLRMSIHFSYLFHFFFPFSGPNLKREKSRSGGIFFGFWCHCVFFVLIQLPFKVMHITINALVFALMIVACSLFACPTIITVFDRVFKLVCFVNGLTSCPKFSPNFHSESANFLRQA